MSAGPFTLGRSMPSAIANVKALPAILFAIIAAPPRG
jgi:hypothetical protein